MNNFNRLKQKILRKNFKMAVIGLGYVGLPLALEFAKRGIFVLGIEVDRDENGGRNILLRSLLVTT